MEVKSKKFYRTESVMSVDLLSKYTNKICNLIDLKKEGICTEHTKFNLQWSLSEIQKTECDIYIS